MNLTHLGDLPNWSDYDRVAIDIETRDPDLTKTGPGVRRGIGYITGVSFACEGGPADYLPMRHEGGGNYSNPDQVLEYLRHQGRHFRGEIVGANLPYDLDWMEEAGVTFGLATMRDIQVSGPLLDQPKMAKKFNSANGSWFWGDEFHSMSLDAQAKRLELPGKDETGLNEWAKERGLSPKSDMWRAPASVVSQYAIQDAKLPLEILALHEKEIEAQDLQKVFDLESKLLPVLLKMRRRGVAVDLSKLERIEKRAWVLEQSALEELRKLTGVTLTTEDTNKSAALAMALEADGVTVPKTEVKISERTGNETGGGPSVTSPWLRELGTPVAEAVLTAKKWNKVRTTFCQSIRTHEIKGRIHCTFNQLRQEREDGSMRGAAFGRLSSSQPNLQQQPARDPEIGPLWRSLYLPDEGGQWACLDFSSQEPRMIIHYAELAGCRMGKEAANACRTDPNWDNHQMTADMCGIERKEAKTIFLGLCLAEGTLIHTDTGRKPIETVTTFDRLWDGTEFVSHGGVIETGEKECIEIEGIWMTPTHEVLTPDGWFQAQDLYTGSLDWFMGLLPSCPLPLGSGEGSSPSSVVAPVVDRLLRAETIWSPENRHAVLNVVKSRLLRHVHDTAMCQTPIVKDFLTGLVQSLAAASRNLIPDTGNVESTYILPGSMIEECFSDTWSRFRDGMMKVSILIEPTMMGTMSPEIFASSHTVKTCRTLDVLDAGPRNRFCVGIGLIVSNCYGMGGGKLCRSLGLPTVWETPSWANGRSVEMAGPEGAALIDKFNDMVPYVKELQLMVRNKAEKMDFIKTLLGRRCRFPRNPQTGKLEWLHKGLNRLIQGSAADQTKMAMVLADEAGIKMQLQVHDELDLTIHDIKEAEQLGEIMVSAIELNVPTRCDIEVGPTWGELEKIS